MPNYWKFIITFLLVLTFAFYLLTLSYSKAIALEMSSEYYKIKGSDLTISSTTPSSSDDKATRLQNDNYLLQFDTLGYSSKTGLSYLKSSRPFTFSLSNTKIEFGTLKPAQPVVQSTQIVIENGPTRGYQFLLAELDSLSSKNGTKIPDTTCEGDKNQCTILLSKPWNSNTNYGYGFGLIGKNIPNDFKNISYFRPFINISKDHKPITILSSNQHNITNQLIINFKLNLPALSDKGPYQNEIVMYAIPGY